MDPDKLLEKILGMVWDVQVAGADSLEKPEEVLDCLAEDIGDLDSWLTNGGFLPDKWERVKHVPRPKPKKKAVSVVRLDPGPPPTCPGCKTEWLAGCEGGTYLHEPHCRGLETPGPRKTKKTRRA